MKNLSSILPAFAVLIIGIILSILLQTKRNEAQSNLKKREIELVIENKTISIQKQLESSFSSIEILQYLFEKNDQISRKEFQNYTVPIFHGNSSIKAISWVPVISYQDRAKFESKISKELGLIGFSITQLNSNNEKTPSEKLSCYFPVTYIEPFTENSKAIGYDIYSDKTRHATIDKALNKKEIQITPRIKLVQDTSGYSFLAIAPVLQSTDPLEKRVNKDFPKGLISAVYKIDKLINDALVHTKNNDVDLVIWDVTSISREYIYGTKKQFDKRQNIQKRKLQVSGREWELNYVINPAFYKITDAQSYLLAGISISLLLFFLLLWPFI